MVTFTEVASDPFAAPEEPKKRTKFTEVEVDPFAEKQSTAGDMARAVPASLARGSYSLAGVFGSGSDALAEGSNYLGNLIAKKLGYDPYTLPDKSKTLNRYVPTPQDIETAAQPYTGELYRAKTVPGKFVETVGELVPGALVPFGGAAGSVGRNAARNIVNYAVAPGIASEAAGQVLSGTPYEAPARVAASVVASGGASLVNRPSSVEQALRSGMSPQVNGNTVANATRLMDDAAARGINLTWAEALEQVAPGSGLVNVQRVVESTKEGRDVLGPMFAQRPGQIDRAAGQAFDALGQANPNPSTIGPAVQRAASGELEGVRGAINNASDPFYTAAAAQRIDPAEMSRVTQIPGWAEASRAIRNDPQLARYVTGLPDDSVGFLNEVKKYLDAAGENAAQAIGTRGRNMQRSAGYGQDAEVVRNTAQRASQDYSAALDIQRIGREQYLQPLLDGPLGKLAKTDLTTRQAMEALFPSNPLPNSAQEIERTVRALVRRDPAAAQELLRAHAESTFNEAARNLQPGANQFAGSKFAVRIAGNPQQRQNLEAATIASGPDGRQVWDGFNRFLEIVEATGKRQAIGSKTAFNAQDLKDLSSGGVVGNAIKTGASPGKWVTAISDAWSRWQLGGNLTGIAEVLANPRSRALLERVASQPVDSAAGAVLAARILAIAETSANKRTAEKTRQPQ